VIEGAIPYDEEWRLGITQVGDDLRSDRTRAIDVEWKSVGCGPIRLVNGAQRRCARLVKES
jgi:hypothetical protein